MWNTFDGHYWGMHFFWWIFWILLIAWILLMPYKKKRKKDTSIDILKKRFASGEITKEEFEETKQLLDKT